MARKRSPARPASGGKRLTASGRKPVLLGLTPEQHATLKAAAQKDGRPMTQFALRAALAAAEKILEIPSASP